MTQSKHASALGALYAERHFQPRSWTDSSDPAFIAIHLIERSIALLAPRLRGELLDVGCGREPYRPYFAHVTKHAKCDHDSSRGDVDFTCPADQIPAPAESYDAILCTEVLEHVPDPLAVWREFHRLLRPGGRVLLTTPMYWPSHEVPYDFYRFPEHGLRHLATTANFEVEELLPRGGVWALLGQVGMHVMGHYLPLPALRRAWSRTFLLLDRSRNNASITMGWTVLARKSLSAGGASGAAPRETTMDGARKA